MNFHIKHKDQDYLMSADYRRKSKSLLFLIHGLGCAKDSFSDIFNDNRFENFSILAPDLLGYGESSKPAEFSYTMEEQAEVLQSLLKILEYDEIYIVAHSMGNAVGLLLTKQLENVKGYANVEGNLISEDAGLLSRKTASVSYDVFEKKVFDELRQVIGSLDEVGAKLWVEQTKRASPLAFYKSAISLMEWSDTGELLKIFQALHCKKVYIYGSENNQMPVLSRIGEIEKREVQKSGHFVMNDNPQEFYIILLKFLY